MTRSGYTLSVLTLACAFALVDRLILSLLVGPIKHDLAISDFQVSLLQGMSFALLYAFLALPVAHIADHWSRRNIVVISILVWSCMTMACGLAGRFSTLFIARMGVGAGEAGLSPSAYSLLSDAFPASRLPFATSVYTMGSIVGAGLALIIGGSVVSIIPPGGHISVPIIGLLSSWQVAFMVVGLPGLLIGALALGIAEPARRGVLRDSGGREIQNVPVRQVLIFAAARWKGYLTLTGGISVLALFGFGYMNWYPTYLNRSFGMTAAEAGIWLGVLFLIFGPAGSYCGARLVAILKRKGHADANLRAVLFIALAFLPLPLGTLIPNSALAVAAAAPTVFLLNAHFGIAIAALQLITPNQMRALVSAMFLLAVNLIGLGLGPSIVAFLTDYVFGDNQALGKSLAVTASLSASLAAMILAAGLGAYRDMLQQAAAWTEPAVSAR